MGLTGTWSQAEGGRGGTNGQRKRQQTQACGAGIRVERQSLVGGGCGLRPGGQRFAPGQEVGRR